MQVWLMNVQVNVVAHHGVVGPGGGMAVVDARPLVVMIVKMITGRFTIKTF